MPERARAARETIARLRALADEMEADLPPGDGDGDGDGDDGPDRALSARERARRLGIRIIQGGAVTATIAAIAGFARDHAAATALMVATAAAAGGATLAPVVAPAIPGLPVIGGNSTGSSPTRTVSVPRPGPTVTVTATPAPTAPPSMMSPAPHSTSPTPAPSRSRSPADDGAAVPSRGPVGGGSSPSAKPGPNPPPAGDVDDSDDSDDSEPPSSEAEPAPATSCALSADLPPLLGLCVLPD